MSKFVTNLLWAFIVACVAQTLGGLIAYIFYLIGAPWAVQNFVLSLSSFTFVVIGACIYD